MTLVTGILAIHLAALSQVESGDRDGAVGASGEVSRYQITPQEWRRAVHLARAASGGHWAEITPADSLAARIIAFDIWSNRLELFRTEQNRWPSVQELYLIWHRPGRVLHPTAAERERAQRFSNLVESLDTPMPPKATVSLRQTITR